MPVALLEHESLVTIAVGSLVLLALTQAAARACRRRSAAVIHGVWAVGLGGCLAIPAASWLSPVWSLPVLPAELTASPRRANAVFEGADATDWGGRHEPARIGGPLGGARRDAVIVVDAAAADAQRVGRSPIADRSDVPSGDMQTAERARRMADPNFKGNLLERSAAIAFAWLAGTTAVLVRLLQQAVEVDRCRRRATNVGDVSWLQLRDAVARQLGVSARVALKIHASALTPMVAGVRSPAVLLPPDALSWAPERRRLVLLHELAHIQRRDVLTQLMAAVACAIYWFNPLAWRGASQMKRLREIACDDVVVTHAKAPRDYAQLLLDVAQGYRSRQLVGAVAMARTSHVETRIYAILNAGRNRAALTKRWERILAATSLIAATVIGTCQLSSRAEEARPQATTPAREPAAPAGAIAGEKEHSPGDERQETAGRTMAVHVLNEAGEPIPRAKIFANISVAEGEKRIHNRDYFTDNRGRVDIVVPLRTSLMRLWPSKEGYVPLFVNFEEQAKDEGIQTPDRYVFRMPQGEKLSGRVVDAAGNPIAGANVQVKVEGGEPLGDAAPPQEVNAWLAYGSNAAVTDGDGRWQITNAPAPLDSGDYDFKLQITHPAYAGDSRWGELQEQQGVTAAALRNGAAIVKLEAGLAIKGRITSPDGTPVTKGLVVWSARPYWAEGANETQIDQSGRYESERLAPGTYPVTVLAPGFAPVQKMVELNSESDDFDFQLDAGKRIQIKIMDASGAPIAGAYVRIGQWRNTEAIYNDKHSNVPESGVPRRANGQGVYQWDWAPADAVQYRISAKGYDEKVVTLVAKFEPHVVVLPPPMTIRGNVVDAVSGEPVEAFRAIPVKEFRPDFFSTDFQANAVAAANDGRFELRIRSYGQTGNRYRVRIEADGYRTALGQKTLEVGDPALEEDFRLEPAPALVGVVRNPDGTPADHFTVAVGTATTAPHFNVDRVDRYFGQALDVRDSDEFTLAATFEPQRIRVFNESGFIEALCQPDDTIGTLQLQPWASVTGRLMQGEEPVGDVGVSFHPLVERGLTEARFQDSFYTTTDAEGRFRFDRLPPMAGAVKAQLGPWEASPLTSSEAIPLVLEPGDHQEVMLGGKGATITGRVVATGRSNKDLSKRWSLNYLISRDRGLPYPADAQRLSFRPSGPLQLEWLRQDDFHSWVVTREHHFVKLADDGQLRIHGVEPGEYNLVIQLYEQPAGCLVETIGQQVVPLIISDRPVGAGAMALGDIEIVCRTGPRVGSDMRAFQFADASGQVRYVDDMGGRYVLLHAWATWCKPCLAAMPSLEAAVEKHAGRPLTVVGLNVDEDAAAAQKMAKSRGWIWAQNYLGKDSDLMRQLAVSSVPAYYLIGPDGKLVGSANQWEQLEPLLNGALE